MANYDNDTPVRDAAFIEECRASVNRVPNAILGCIPFSSGNPTEVTTRGLRILLQQRGIQMTMPALGAELDKLVKQRQVKRYTRKGVEYCQRK